jgi:hypothetical protein
VVAVVVLAVVVRVIDEWDGAGRGTTANVRLSQDFLEY